MTSALRRCAEIMLGSVVLRRSIPDSIGRAQLVVNGKVGGLKYLFKAADQWDPELLKIVRLLVKPGDVVWDVGANVGLFSKAAAVISGPSGRVLSLEADIDAVRLLYRTNRLASSGHAEMTVIPVAAGKRSGFVRFSIARRARAANAIEGYGSTQTGGILETRTIPCVTLDSLIENFPAPDVLKIDVEGAECEVLDGATQILTNSRPAIYCEVDGKSANRVAQMFEQYSYQMWNGADFDGVDSPCISIASANTVAIPEEKIEKYCVKNAKRSTSNVAD